VSLSQRRDRAGFARDFFAGSIALSHGMSIALIFTGQ
jgi:hypothetical protein